MSDAPRTKTNPSYDEWVEYCFTKGLSDFPAPHDNSDVLRFVYEIDPLTLVGHIIRLFEQPEFLLDRYSPDDIGRGVAFIVGVPSEYLAVIYKKQFDDAQRSRVYQAVASLYEHCMDPLTVAEEAGSQTGCNHGSPLQFALFTLWESGGLGWSIVFGKYGRMQAACFEAMERVLHTCKSIGCRESALCGYAYLGMRFQAESGKAFARYLSKRHQPAWLRRFARAGGHYHNMIDPEA